MYYIDKEGIKREIPAQEQAELLKEPDPEKGYVNEKKVRDMALEAEQQVLGGATVSDLFKEAVVELIKLVKPADRSSRLQAIIDTLDELETIDSNLKDHILAAIPHTQFDPKKKRAKKK